MKCPLEKTDPGHYQYVMPQPTVQSLINMLRNKSTGRRRRPLVYTDDNGFAILPFPEKAYFRLFKKRRSDKVCKRVQNKKRYAYAVFNSSREVVSVAKTKKAAQAILAKDSTYKFFKNKRMKTDQKLYDVDIGSHILKINEKSMFVDGYREKYDFHDAAHLRVDSKRCSSCPNTYSTQGQCACSLLKLIKDATPGWVFWSKESHKHYKKKRVPQRKILVNVDDLLDN
jgi:hypothetical protein